jgi:hypothetical protein
MNRVNLEVSIANYELETVSKELNTNPLTLDLELSPEKIEIMDFIRYNSPVTN